MDMDVVWITASLLLLLLLYKLIDYYRQVRLQRKVAWCMSKKKRYGALTECIFNDYRFTKVPETENQLHGGNNEDFKMVRVLLEDYQRELSTRYFDGTLVSNISKLREYDFFMLTLCAYLELHECDMEICGNKLFNVIERKEYIETCEPTDFGVVYLKLRYATELFCENNKHIETSRNKSAETKKNLDSKQVKFIYHRK